MNQKLIITISLAAIILSGCDCGVRNEVTTKPEPPKTPVAEFEVESDYIKPDSTQHPVEKDESGIKYGPKLNFGPSYNILKGKMEFGPKWHFGPRWEF